MRGVKSYGQHHVLRSLHYRAKTKVGDCGLPVFAADSTLRSHKILGFHVAATDNGDAYGNVIT